MKNTETALKQKVARIASTLFLIVAMMIAGLVTTNTFIASDATALDDDSSICYYYDDVVQECGWHAMNCLCETTVYWDHPDSEPPID